MWLSYLKNMLLIKCKFRGKKLQLATTLVPATDNASDYLPSTIKSIRSQANKNFERIVFDNCSSDNTLEILRKSRDVVSDLISKPDLANKTFHRRTKRSIESMCVSAWRFKERSSL